MALDATHGQQVQAGRQLLELKRSELDFELTRVEGELLTQERRLSSLQAARLRGAHNENADSPELLRLTADEEEARQQVAGLKSQQAELRRQRDALKVVAPIGGEILTWDVRRTLEGRPVLKGQQLLTVGDVAGAWELDLKIVDEYAGYVRRAADRRADRRGIRRRLLFGRNVSRPVVDDRRSERRRRRAALDRRPNGRVSGRRAARLIAPRHRGYGESFLRFGVDRLRLDARTRTLLSHEGLVLNSSSPRHELPVDERPEGNRRMNIATTGVLWLLLVTPGQTSAADPIVVNGALVTAIAQTDVPARAEGVLTTIQVVEGANVALDQILAEIDSREAELLLAKAEAEAAIAATKAKNDADLRFARKSAEVAKAELKRSQESIERFERSISQTELDKMVLEAERAHWP
ncbi:MAG: biotin/lipoyl-binding protein [Pirellulales bacterium]